MNIIKKDYEPGEEFDTVVISDLHIGAPESKHLGLFIDTLESLHITGRIVIAGDFVDVWKLGRVPDEGLIVLNKLISMAPDMVYNRGNHDDTVQKLGDITTTDKTDLTIGGVRFHIEHGDRFDPLIKGNREAAILASKLQYISELVFRFNPSSFFHFVNEQDEDAEVLPFRKARHRERIKDATIDAAKHGFNVVIHGHNHVPLIEHVVVKGKSITYVNDGDWIEHSTFVGIKTDGSTYLVYVEKDEHFQQAALQHIFV